MRSDRERTRDFYPYQYPNSKGKSVSRKSKHSGVSLWFCWGFSFVVAAVFGIASFLMFSAGHFDISPDTYEGAAWGGSEGEENFTSTRSLVQVEVTELDTPDDLPDPEELYAEARSNMMEEFGPFPKYLSNYESIILSVTEDGTKLPVNEDEEEEEIIEVKTPQAAPEVPKFTEQGPFWVKHVVKNGETLSDIAKAYGNITAQDILRANGLKDANRLAENQLLFIPNDPGKVEETLEEVRTRQLRVATIQEQGKVEPIVTKNYVVTQGDSLWSIANSQNIELDTLVGSNTFKTSARLRPGAILRIPNQDGIFYVMKKGEDIEAVSKRYGVSMNKIRQVNTTQNVDALRAGDEIFLPDAKLEGVIEHKDVKLAEVKKSAPAKTQKAPAKTPAKAEKPSGGEVAVRRAKGGFRWPVMGRINSPFGWRTHPITRRKDFHTGIDIKADRNDPIKAAGSGRIVYSGWMGGYGKVLVIEHSNGQSTLYAHCSTLLAGKGASVSSGQLVARVGTTGRSTGPHLHFEVRNGNSPVNPIKYLSR